MQVIPGIMGISQRPQRDLSGIPKTRIPRFGEKRERENTTDRRILTSGLVRVAALIGIVLTGIATAASVARPDTTAKPDQTALQKPPDIKPPAPPMLTPLSGKIQLGTEGGWILNTGNQRYNLKNITPDLLKVWFKKDVQVEGIALNEGRPFEQYKVDKIQPANLAVAPLLQQGKINPPEKHKAFKGTILSYDEKRGMAVLKSENTGLHMTLDGITPEKLAAWFQPNVVVKVRGVPNNRPDTEMQGTPFNVASIRPVINNAAGVQKTVDGTLSFGRNGRTAMITDNTTQEKYILIPDPESRSVETVLADAVNLQRKSGKPVVLRAVGKATLVAEGNTEGAVLNTVYLEIVQGAHPAQKLMPAMMNAIQSLPGSEKKLTKDGKRLIVVDSQTKYPYILIPGEEGVKAELDKAKDLLKKGERFSVSAKGVAMRIHDPEGTVLKVSEIKVLPLKR